MVCCTVFSSWAIMSTCILATHSITWRWWKYHQWFHIRWLYRGCCVVLGPRIVPIYRNATGQSRLDDDTGSNGCPNVWHPPSSQGLYLSITLIMFLLRKQRIALKKKPQRRREYALQNVYPQRAPSMGKGCSSQKKSELVQQTFSDETSLVIFLHGLKRWIFISYAEVSSETFAASYLQASGECACLFSGCNWIGYFLGFWPDSSHGSQQDFVKLLQNRFFQSCQAKMAYINFMG